MPHISDRRRRNIMKQALTPGRITARLMFAAYLTFIIACNEAAHREWLDNLYSDRTIEENSQYVFLSQRCFLSLCRSLRRY